MAHSMSVGTDSFRPCVEHGKVKPALAFCKPLPLNEMVLGSSFQFIPTSLASVCITLTRNMGMDITCGTLTLVYCFKGGMGALTVNSC